jgi:hypothetical protein
MGFKLGVMLLIGRVWMVKEKSPRYSATDESRATSGEHLPSALLHISWFVRYQHIFNVINMINNKFMRCWLNALLRASCRFEPLR